VYRLYVIFRVGLLAVHFATNSAAILGPARALLTRLHLFHIAAQHRPVACNIGHTAFKLRKKTVREKKPADIKAQPNSAQRYQPPETNVQYRTVYNRDFRPRLNVVLQKENAYLQYR
jgi:hypothetical protein